MRSLIVEDDAVSRVLLEEILAQYGEVVAVESGVEGLALFLEEKFDLICLDINMPSISGHQVLAYIRAYEKASGLNPWETVKIIITSVLKDKENVFKAFRGTADGYLAKPFEVDMFHKYLKDFKLIEQ